MTGLETRLAHLSGTDLDDLFADDSPELEAQIETVAAQVEKPRTNLGSSGPPGRTD